MKIALIGATGFVGSARGTRPILWVVNAQKVERMSFPIVIRFS
jgi:hypothetical protein